MKFTKDSEQIMSLMMDEFEMFVKKKTVSQQRSFDRIMKIFYTEIKFDIVPLVPPSALFNCDTSLRFYSEIIPDANNAELDTLPAYFTLPSPEDYKLSQIEIAADGKLYFLSLASESRVLKKLSESHIFVSTKKLTKYGTLQAQQKQQ